MRPVVLDARCAVFCGDAINASLVLRPESVDAVVTDPPAGIDFMAKGWDSDKGGRDAWIAWLRDIMRGALAALKPGGHAFVWAIPRTSHWTATALEDAGFEIRDVVMHLFGTGFPKSLNVSKAIDQKLGNTRPVIATREQAVGFDPSSQGGGGWSAGLVAETAPGSVASAAWEGWGTALKPACEHWILARKPLAGTVAENVLTYGTGGLNIDACRISTAGETFTVPQSDPRNRKGGDAVQPGALSDVEAMQAAQRASIARTAELGRWPAHLTLDEDAAAALDEQSGTLTSGKMRAGTPRGENAVFGKLGGALPEDTRADTGGASRFFYVAKAPRSEKEAGLDHLAPRSAGGATDREDGSAGLNSPRAGAGRTGGARNFHPTVKNLALMRWLIKLITPPGGTVLDLFAGSGSTLVAALQEGFNAIGIEQGGEGEEYIPILEGRIRHALANTRAGESVPAT